MNSIKMFDSHAHYTDDRYKSELNITVDELLTSLFEGNVGYIVNVGTNFENSVVAIKQAKKYENMFVAVGIHPSDSKALGEFDFELSKIESLLKHQKENKIVALGEIGFDYHYEDTDKQTQVKYFKEQMKLAQKYSLPVIIHNRDAHGDSLDMISDFPEVKGVFHSYSGSVEMANQLVKKGYYISFSGVITFKNAMRVCEVAKNIPLDRIIIETDCPYLAPHPYRGKLNHSGLMLHTAQKLSEIFGLSVQQMSEVTKQNACKVFGITP